MRIRIVSCLFFFCFSMAEAILLDEQFMQSLNARYGAAIMEPVPVPQHKLNRIEAKELMNAIEEDFAEEIEKRSYQQINQRIAGIKQKTEFQSLIQRCLSLNSGLARCKFSLEILKCIVLAQQIPSMIEFLPQQLHFLHEMATILEKDQDASWEDYPSNDHNPTIRYIHCDQGVPCAVFKPSTHSRDPEVTFWEMSFLFGLTEVSVPASPVMIQDTLGVLHRFLNTDVLQENLFKEGLHYWIARSAFLQASLAVLLFAFQDIHSGNMAYQITDEGYFTIKLFDTSQAFTRTHFSCGWRDGVRILRIPYAWVGWDYPQAKMKLSKQESLAIKQRCQQWSEEDVFAYINNPLTHTVFTRQQLDELIQRMQTIKNGLQKRTTSLQLLATLEPRSPQIRAKLKKFFPKDGPSRMLFQLRWRPLTLRSWLSAHKQEAFETWLIELEAEIGSV